MSWGLDSPFRFGQQKTYYYVPSESCESCAESDRLYLLNPPLIGLIRIIEDMNVTEEFRSTLLFLVNELLNGDLPQVKSVPGLPTGISYSKETHTHTQRSGIFSEAVCKNGKNS